MNRELERLRTRWMPSTGLIASWFHHGRWFAGNLLGVIALLPFASSASLITDGSFDAGFGSPSSNNVEFQHLDDGWIQKNNGWAINSGRVEYVQNSTTANKSGLGQASSITTETGNEYRITFDWEPVAANLDLNYTVAAFIAGTTPGTTDRFFTGLNFVSAQSRVIGTGGSWIDLGDGSTHGGNSNAQINTFTGTAGVSSSSSLDLDFGTSNIEDYDYIGVKFWVGDGTVAGGFIDNVSISAIPEPGAFLPMLTLVPLLFFVFRRKVFSLVCSGLSEKES